MPDQSGEKSQEATPHRKRQAREKGQVATSQDLTSAAVLVAALVVIMMFGGAVIEFAGTYMRRQLAGDAWLVIDPDLVVIEWHWLVTNLSIVLLPIFGLLFVSAILINLMQVGFLFVPQRLAPDISRVNPLAGLKRLFSLASVMRLTFGIFKTFVIAGVAMSSLYAQRGEILALASLEIPQIATAVMGIAIWTAIKVGVALLILALFDYAYQRWKHEQELRMTPQEVREEMKNLQGDPQIIARRRAVQRQLALNRMGDAVPSADVVITNPTELAVAIQYKPTEMAAPIVVAKGAGVIAQRIRRLALEHDVPIVEKKPLARLLYKEVEVNHPVTDESFAAVAEVLAYVYQLKGKTVGPPPDAAA